MTHVGPLGNHSRKSNKFSIPSPEKPQRTKNYAMKNEHTHELHSVGKRTNDNGLPHEKYLENNMDTNGYDDYSRMTQWPEKRYTGKTHEEDNVNLVFWNYDERIQGEVSPNAVTDKHMRDICNGNRWDRQFLESTDNKAISKSTTTENKVVLNSDSVKCNAAEPEPEPKRVVPLKPERSKKLKGKYGVKDQSERDIMYLKLFDKTKETKSEESSAIEKMQAFSTQPSMSLIMDSTAAVPKENYTANGNVGESRKFIHPPQTCRKLFQDTEDKSDQRLSADEDLVCFEDTSPLSDFPSNLIFSSFEQMTPLYSHVKSQKSREMLSKQSSPTDSSYSLLKSSSLESAQKKSSVTTAWHLLVSHRNYRHRMNFHILML